MDKFKIKYMIKGEKNELIKDIIITFNDTSLKIKYKATSGVEEISYNELVDVQEIGSGYVIIVTKSIKYLFCRVDFQKVKIYKEFTKKLQDIILKNKKEKVINFDFDIPYYIFEEIIEYIEQIHSNKLDNGKWKNIKSLLRLALINGRLTKEQVTYIEETYCREN